MINCINKNNINIIVMGTISNHARKLTSFYHIAEENLGWYDIFQQQSIHLNSINNSILAALNAVLTNYVLKTKIN